MAPKRLVAHAAVSRDTWISDRWWILLVLPQMALGLFFLLLPLARGGSYYLARTKSDPYAYGWLLVLLSIPYGLAILAMLRTGRTPSKRALWTGFAVAALPMMLAPLAQTDDVFQYLFYAKIQLAHGANPYITSPAAFSQDPWFAYAAWPRQVSVYGPLWSLIVAAATALTGQHLVAGVLAVKVIATLSIAAAIGGLMALTSEAPSGIAPRSSMAAAAFAFHPLVLTSGPLGGHPDALLAACFVWAIVLDQRRRPILAGLLLTASALVKAYAVLPLIVYCFVLWRRGDVRPARLARGAAAAVALVVACYVPYWVGLRTLRGFVEVGTFSSSGLAGTIQGWLEIVVRHAGIENSASVASVTVRIVAAGVLFAVGYRLVRSDRALQEPWWAATLLLMTFMLVTPWFLPWYVVGLMALAAPLMDRTLSAPIFLFGGTQLIQVPGLAGVGRTIARYGPPLAYRRRLRRRAPLDR